MSDFNSAMAAIARAADTSGTGSVLDETALKPLYEYIEDMVRKALNYICAIYSEECQNIKSFRETVLAGSIGEYFEKALAILATIVKIVKQNIC